MSKLGHGPGSGPPSGSGVGEVATPVPGERARGVPVATSEWARRYAAGDKRALARLLSWIEDVDPRAEEVMAAVADRRESAWVIGITGPPGVGKSSLVDRLAGSLLASGHRVGILAVDPSSPFSGGAVLGDRIRMQRAVLHEHAFVRSTATRGALGGLARTTAEAVRALDLFGFGIVLVETVGVGQSEVEIVGEADTSVVIEAPGMGDSVQAIKAGILEIGDLFVVNKADRPEASRAALEIEGMLSLAGEHRPWMPRVLMTSCAKGDGIAEVIEELHRHHAHLQETGRLEELRRRRRESHFVKAVLARTRGAFDRFLEGPGEAALVESVRRGERSAEAAARQVTVRFTRGGPAAAGEEAG